MAGEARIPVWREISASPPPAGGAVEQAPLVIVGGGPIGLALALDLGRRGHPIILLNKLEYIAAGSRSICISKRSLDIFDRLGVGQAMVDKGVTWNIGKVFRGSGEAPIYEFDLLPVKAQKRPAFVNIQQYHVEERLFEALAKLPNVALRWGHEVVGVATAGEGMRIEVEAGGTAYSIMADWLIACDGSHSTVRQKLGLDFAGRAFEDNFLIADIRMKQERPAERWFWFDPPFNQCRSALLHKQPDDVWRLDFQLGPDIDRATCLRPENVEPYVRAMLGDEVEFSEEWYSVYTFQCRRMDRFVHGRTVFAGDSAHLVSPFGARGCNGGIADVDNLGWKLDLVLRGAAPASLLDSYDLEATIAADENILNATRATDFMTPQSAGSQALRDAVLELAERHAFARPFVNSGRLSTAIDYPDSPLSTADREPWHSGIEPGAPAVDAPLGDGWLLERLGDRFVLLAEQWGGPVPEGVELVDIARVDGDLGILRQRYGLEAGSAYLLRPDQYVAARWRSPDRAQVEAALQRATGVLS